MVQPATFYRPSLSKRIPRSTDPQISLVKTADGRYVPRGYVGGFPFANPMAGAKDEVGAKMYYNNYYRPAPVVEQAPELFLELLHKYANGR